MNFVASKMERLWRQGGRRYEGLRALFKVQGLSTLKREWLTADLHPSWIPQGFVAFRVVPP